ncbi:hypothetical protein [Poinsettia branch-inducing phytoplasma]|uniref:hypothetical protein n=1 Tax=Poinsettia branch-inducing phytoplasma TaxID=138647 RepID=UPI000369E39B|nr:hypothetical protein [Poinsettia branch-inducing phytoplasma]
MSRKCKKYAKKIIDNWYTAKLRDVGYTAFEVRCAGYTAFELRLAGYKVEEMIEAGLYS